MKTKYLLTLLLTAFFAVAQSQGIKVGQKVPNIEINQIIRYQNSHARLSDFRGKFLLLDFWFTSCGACINAMPSLQQFQNKYGNTLQILMVAHENKDKVNRFFRETRSVQRIGLPTVVADSVLQLFFPHITDPTEVWIDDKGIVQAITEGSYVTDSNLQKFLHGEVLNLPQKTDAIDASASQTRKPIILYDYDKYRNGILYYSFLSKARSDLAALSARPELNIDDTTLRIHSTNVSIGELYKLAFDNMDWPDSRVVSLLTDTSKIHLFNWAKNNLYCYDIMLKDTSAAKLFTYMRQDLDHYFGVKSSLKKRILKCLVLKRTDNGFNLVTKGGKAEHITNGRKYEFYNMTLGLIQDNFFNYMRWLKEPIINETDYTGKVDVKFDFTNLETLKKSAAEYGLAVVEEDRLLDVILLEDR